MLAALESGPSDRTRANLLMSRNSAELVGAGCKPAPQALAVSTSSRKYPATSGGLKLERSSSQSPHSGFICALSEHDIQPGQVEGAATSYSGSQNTVTHGT